MGRTRTRRERYCSKHYASGSSSFSPFGIPAPPLLVGSTEPKQVNWPHWRTSALCGHLLCLRPADVLFPVCKPDYGIELCKVFRRVFRVLKQGIPQSLREKDEVRSFT
jgi:hypothetical protein